MNRDLRGSAAHVVVADLEAPLLDDGDRHHLRAVLRLRPGERITATDGHGRWASFRWGADGELTREGPVRVSPAAAKPVTVACAIPKGDRPEWLVEKLTEIGVDRVLWIETRRSVVRWDAAKAAKNAARLDKIARAAAMQSRRTRLPCVEGPVPLDTVLPGPGVAVADPEGDRGLPRGTHTVIVGPEGGFDPSELPRDVPRVCLAPTVLRVETAAFLAGYLLIAE